MEQGPFMTHIFRIIPHICNCYLIPFRAKPLPKFVDDLFQFLAVNDGDHYSIICKQDMHVAHE